LSTTDSESESTPLGELLVSVRSWDFAHTQDGGDWTVGAKIDYWSSRFYVIADIIRGQWSSGKRDAQLYSAAEMDGKDTYVIIEREGGAGIDVIASIKKRMRGWMVYGINPRTGGAKEIRAQPFAAAAEAGMILVAKANWNAALMDELVTWPKGATKDQVDALAQGYSFIDKMEDRFFGGDLIASGQGSARDIREEHTKLGDEEIDQLGGDLADIIRGIREDPGTRRRR